MAALGRALGPFVVSYFFSLSTHFEMTNPMRQLVWIVFVLLNLPGLYLANKSANETAQTLSSEKSDERGEVGDDEDAEGETAELSYEQRRGEL